MSSVKRKLMNYSGIWFRKIKYLHPGADLFTDLRKNTKYLNLIIDVGANVGQSVDRFKEMYPDSTIYSFEPVLDTFKQLLQHTKRYSGVHCKNIALGIKEDEIEITLSDTPLSGKNTLNIDQMNKRGNAKKQLIQIDTLDHFAELNNIQHIDLLKIDTEGWELNVIRGADHLIRAGKIDFLFCEVGFNRENKQNTYFPDLNEHLVQHGYQLFSFYDYGHAKLKRGSQYANALFVNTKLCP